MIGRALLLLLALVAPLAAAQGFGGVDPAVSARVLWSQECGYTPVHLSVSSSRPRALAVRVFQRGTEGTASLAVPAGRSDHVVLLPPHPGSWSNSIELEWRSDDGRSGEDPYVTTLLDRDDVLAVVDVGRTVQDQGLIDVLVDWNTWGRYGGHGAAEFERVDPRQLPAQWQGYPLHRALLLTAASVELLSAAQRQALDRWSRAGGHLWLTGGAPAELGLPHATRVEPPWDRSLPPAWRRLQRDRSFVPAEVPVPGTEEVPADLFVICAIAFALAVGPLNLWWAHRKRRRWLFLVGTPVISLATCLLLVTVNLVSEGVTTRRVVDQLVWLDGERHQAVSWTGVTAFAPFAPGDGTMPPTTRVTPFDPEEYQQNRHYGWSASRSRSSLRVAWSGGQELAGGWIPPRVNRRLLYVQPQALRQRLLLQRSADAVVVVNGTETTLEAFEWRDAEGRPWSAGAVEPGATAALQPGGSDLPGSVDRLDQAARSTWSRCADAGHFRARLAAPLVDEPGFGGRDERPPRAWLCGPLALEAQP